MGLFDMIKKLHPESRLFGFLAGPHGVYSNNYMEITQEYMHLYRNTGGFDMIRKYIAALTAYHNGLNHVILPHLPHQT
jgi:6-phosphofructokinase